MSSINKFLEYLYNWSIFKIKPIRGICSLLTSEGFWASIFGILIICFIIYKLLGASFFNMIGFVIKGCFMSIKKLIKFISYLIKETYMMILFYIDSKKNNYKTELYWANRTITVKGIVSTDVTGVEVLVINHPILIKKGINLTLIINRAFFNVLLLIKNSLKKVI